MPSRKRIVKAGTYSQLYRFVMFDVLILSSSPYYLCLSNARATLRRCSR
jgi:hypothetical protein